MDIIALIALTAAATQIIKKGLEKLLGHDLAPIAGTILAVLVSIFVVSYKAIETSTPFTFALFMIWVQVAIGATGGFKLAKAFLPNLLAGNNMDEEGHSRAESDNEGWD
jgi:uncharacterized protein YacL